MSVLILDMKLPKTCAECEWSRYSFPNAWCGRTHKTTDIEIAKNGRPDWCPLIPVPPHGDLIDRDVAYDKIAEQEGGNYVDMDAVGMGLNETPTIIPAEEGE